MIRISSAIPDWSPGIWGMVFGNGDTLGDANALFYAAGPHDELDGVFGVVRQIAP